MKNKRLLLLKTLLLSTSRINKVRYSRDKKIRGKAIGNLVGMAVIFLMVIGYSVAASVGYGYMGLANGIPVICAAAISSLAFFFTVFKTNGYLFAFKEYDMLMSLPFSPKTVAADKFLYMYVASLPWYVSISVAMLISYGIYARPGFVACLLWILLSLILPVIPMLAASCVGILIARVSSGFRRKNIIQTVLLFIFMIFCFSLQYIIEAFVKSDNTAVILGNISDSIEQIGKGYLPVAWFSSAVRESNLLSALLLIIATFALFELLFALVGKHYRKINSALKSHSVSKTKKNLSYKRSRVEHAIAKKEFRRLTGSQAYMVNGAMGEVLAVTLGLAALIFPFEKIVQFVTKGAPFSSSVLYPAIPLIVYFLVGMVATTACSPSLEGKNYWIVQSLPVEKKVLYRGKMLFNLYLTVPVAVFATVSLSFSARVPLLSAVLYIVQILVLCAFSTAWGCVCGIRHMKLDWENEIEVVKQGAAVSIYLLPNLFVTMGLVVGVVFAGRVIQPDLVSLMVTAVAVILAAACYLRVMKLAEKS